MPYRAKGLVRPLLFACLALVIVVLFFSALRRHFHSFFPEHRQDQEQGSVVNSIVGSYQPFVPARERRPKGESSRDLRVDFGMRIENVYSLSLSGRTFMAEGWYWLRWPEAVNKIIVENKIPPENLLEFVNQVELSNALFELDEPTPRLLQDGYYWQNYRFSGKFYIDDLHLKAFPFDQLDLSFLAEFKSGYLSCSQQNPYGCVVMAFEPRAQQQLIGEFIGINGYDVIGTRTTEFLHEYSTGFGTGEESLYSALQVDVIYRSSFLAALWTYIFPPLLLIGVAILSPSLPGSLGDVRLAIPTTILLTLIFLQIGYRSELPPLAYVSYLDWIFIYAYAVSALLFVLFCWGANAYAIADARGEQESAVRRIKSVDRLVQALALGGLVLVMSAGFLFQA